MNKYISVKESMLKFQLEQLGATVFTVKGNLCYVKFTLADVKFKYLYHINRKGKFFLERIAPYSMPIAAFNSEEEIINTIKLDINKFKNLENSKKFDHFISLDKDLVQISKAFEKIYLHYNISKHDLKDLDDEILTLKNKLGAIIQSSELVLDIDEDINL